MKPGYYIGSMSIANPGLFTTRHYEDLLNRKDIDCIIAAVPDHWHKKVVVDSCNAGKDIYCEKPMSHSIADGIFRWKDGRNMPDLHLVLFDYHGVPVYVRLGLGTESTELARFFGPKGYLDLLEFGLQLSPQTGTDMAPSYYAYGFPQAMRDDYFKKWKAENKPKTGKEPLFDKTTWSGHDYDDMVPHLHSFFESVKSRIPVVKNAVFGNHAAIACHMANESYFRQKQVFWDEPTKILKS